MIYKSATIGISSFKKKFYMCIKLLLNCRLAKKDNLQINAFLNLVVEEQKKSFYALLKKITRKARNKLVREMVG